MTTTPLDLTGKVALVTGASRGIGREIVRKFVGAGARVAINHSKSPEGAMETATLAGERETMIVRADVGRPDEVEEMIRKVASQFGRLDILVNNAAIFALNPFDNHDYQNWQEGWRRTFDVNVFGAANVAFLAMREMRRVGGGKIINIASRAAFRGETEFADYGASKAALVNLTRSIARSCSSENIIATCVAPGFVDTEMAQGELEKHREEILSQIPVGRVGTVEDVANVVLFLASPLSDYLAGVTIDVNGGSYFH